MRHTKKCRCCACTVAQIFRCEQAQTFGMWDVAGLLPVITCDGLPAARQLWVDSAFQTRDTVADRITDGAISVDLNAVGITVNNGGTFQQRLYENGQIRCSLFNNAATATLLNNGGVVGQVAAKQDISLTAGSTTLTRPSETKDSISLISCEAPAGRYVTAHTPNADNSSGVCGGLWVRQSTGFPGYTNQPILGLQNYRPTAAGVALPDALSWACSTAVFRNGELVGTATAQRGSVTPQFVSRVLGNSTGWQWGYSSAHPAELLRGYVSPTIFGNTTLLNAFIESHVPAEYKEFVVTFRVGTVFYNYSPAVGVIVRGNAFSRLDSPVQFLFAGQYRGPFFVPNGGTITVSIPHENDDDIDPLDEINATQFNGLMDASQWASLTQEEGSYLCVSTTTDACDPAGLLDPVAHIVMQGPGWTWPPVPGSGKLSAQQTTIFNSFVIDKTPPPLFWYAFDDMTVAEAAQKSDSEWAILQAVRSDEPIGGAFSNFDDGALAARSRWTPKTYRWLGFEPWQKQTANFDTTISNQTLSPGEYSITVTDPVVDRAGNAALDQPSVTFKVVEGTEDELKGRPIFEIPFEQNALINGQIFGGREYPVQQIDVVFAHNVYGVTKRHFTLNGFGRYLDKSADSPALANGQIPQLMYEFPPDDQNDGATEFQRISPRGITKLERLSDTRVRLTLDPAMQFPGSRWRLFFQPDKQVFWFDDAPEGFSLVYSHSPPYKRENGQLVGETELWSVRFPNLQTWPLRWDVEDEEWKIPWDTVNYPAGDTIDSDDPLAAALSSVGRWIERQKPVLMACRTNWIVVRPPGTTPERIDIGQYNFVDFLPALSSGGDIIGIGGVSSVTTEIPEPDSEGQHWKSQIAASGSMWLSKTPGTFLAGSSNSVDAFVPSVPQSATGQTSEPYSYWGLDTTIYPSTPKRLRSCKAPKSHQPQASVFHGGGDFGIQATLSRVVVASSDGPPRTLAGFVGNYGPVLYSFPTLVEDRFLPTQSAIDIDFFVSLFSNLSFASSGVPNRWLAQPTATTTLGTYYSALKIDRTPADVYGDIYGIGSPGDVGYDQKVLPLADGTNFTFGPIAQIVAGCGEWTLRARRTCTQHLGLSTATPNEVVITISGSAGYNGASSKYPATYLSGPKAWTVGTAGMPAGGGTYSATLVLSRDQESSLVAGQSVAVVADVLSTNLTFGLPQFRYASRHVWNLQRT